MNIFDKTNEFSIDSDGFSIPDLDNFFQSLHEIEAEREHVEMADFLDEVVCRGSSSRRRS